MKQDVETTRPTLHLKVDGDSSNDTPETLLRNLGIKVQDLDAQRVDALERAGDIHKVLEDFAGQFSSVRADQLLDPDNPEHESKHVTLQKKFHDLAGEEDRLRDKADGCAIAVERLNDRIRALAKQTADDNQAKARELARDEFPKLEQQMVELISHMLVLKPHLPPYMRLQEISFPEVLRLAVEKYGGRSVLLTTARAELTLKHKLGDAL